MVLGLHKMWHSIEFRFSETEKKQKRFILEYVSSFVGTTYSIQSHLQLRLNNKRVGVE